MNVKRVIAVCTVLALGAVVYADDAKVLNAVSIDPISIIFNLYSGSYERALSYQVSAKVSVAYSPNFFWVSDIGYFDASVEGRFYLGAVLRNLLADVDVGTTIRDRFLTPGIVGPYVGAFVGGLGASVREWTAVKDARPTYL
ncbi:hypothetical protein MASR2M48_18580 [Spirochaetota bacterium]